MRTRLANTQLGVFDFDNTIAQTFEPSPNGVNVTHAYDCALEQLFGRANLLDALGGLRNRTATEVVCDVLAKFPALREVASHVVGSTMIALLPEALVRLKLGVLLKEIGRGADGTIWPKPCEGVFDVLTALRRQNTRIAIISSGHEPFIRRSFELWGEQCPNPMVTDDDLRRLKCPAEKKAKPSPLLFELLYQKLGVRGKEEVGRIIYFGDDLLKDGQLARNSGVSFGWYNPRGVPALFELGGGSFYFDRWQRLIQ